VFGAPKFSTLLKAAERLESPLQLEERACDQGIEVCVDPEGVNPTEVCAGADYSGLSDGLCQGNQVCCKLVCASWVGHQVKTNDIVHGEVTSCFLHKDEEAPFVQIKFRTDALACADVEVLSVSDAWSDDMFLVMPFLDIVDGGAVAPISFDKSAVLAVLRGEWSTQPPTILFNSGATTPGAVSDAESRITQLVKGDLLKPFAASPHFGVAIAEITTKDDGNFWFIAGANNGLETKLHSEYLISQVFTRVELPRLMKEYEVIGVRMGFILGHYPCSHNAVRCETVPQDCQTTIKKLHDHLSSLNIQFNDVRKAAWVSESAGDTARSAKRLQDGRKLKNFRSMFILGWEAKNVGKMDVTVRGKTPGSQVFRGTVDQNIAATHRGFALKDCEIGEVIKETVKGTDEDITTEVQLTGTLPSDTNKMTQSIPLEITKEKLTILVTPLAPFPWLDE
jgi:hypothetical protein